MADKCPGNQSCPVDHKSRTTWFSVLSGSSSAHPVNASSLLTEREVSSIPRADNEAQFFAAMARKNHNPHAPDMKTIIPIHNACGGVKLVNFKDRPNDLTPKARLMTLLGYSAPFDRHDWVVERCGTRIRYVINFYAGRGAGPTSSNKVSFYLDVRPALDNWEGVKMRAENIWQDWFGSVHSSSSPSQS
ncbi:cytochrome c/c1 heme lyase-domain-containing protein [Suillus clintonianus]|uniref:cytochrome c/c1 heme lyase-domain-containing protein n=1 Tax=Suillus clintonianus TaxID=1904413 RepID=UPI001B86392B|nr:cytochrome c/c1 heme lyase-domain-containing protein [Suillus clintonianus]KAG2150485.1 cytochrome c/c1 heme lyase-domain-containing protein [Suillus clintonianus]